ncbi:hypothetical protein V6N11_005437 [Hibiscus sabdariffa]|uniref:Plant bHLH transcription factor ACT-like domain-containing protein n=1 Tax=Hibiscus sabdariffa TaxID=183260 RepID=A0ABR2RNA2_9ROSI
MRLNLFARLANQPNGSKTIDSCIFQRACFLLFSIVKHGIGRYFCAMELSDNFTGSEILRFVAKEQIGHPHRPFSPLIGVKGSILNVLVHFHKVRVKLEEIQREYQKLMASRNEYLALLNQIQIPKQEVKVEKNGQEFVVKVRCNKGGDELVSIVEAFEQLGLNVVEARVCCNHFFAMEAIVVDQDQQTTDIKHVTQAVLKAIEKRGERMLVT